jgi:hypothetical protein
MINKKRTIVILKFLIFSLTTLKAQQSTTSSGGNSSGIGGTVAYSLGQIVYNTHNGSIGSVAQGVQQPYEISTISGIEDHQISLNIEAYPNPTSDFIQLKIDGEKFQDLSYQIIDVNGKLIENKKIVSSTENIPMGNLKNATYFLKVTTINQEVKTFKIIKN